MVPQESSRRISEQVGRVTQERESPEWHARLLSRRSFIRQAGLAAAAMALLQVPEVLSGRGWIQPAYAAESDLVHHTYNGLLAFVVPGFDPYSVQQRVSTEERGGVGAGITDVLIASMDQAVPFRPNFSVELAGILNGVAKVVNPSASQPFSAPFANLLFPEKVAVFRVLEGGLIPGLQPFATPRRRPAPVRRFLGLLGGRGLRPEYAHADRQAAGLEAFELRGGRGRPRRIQGVLPGQAQGHVTGAEERR